MENTINKYHKVINIGIFAHVDAGKTTITEQLLYKSGAINKIGRVDHGDTVTDSMAQEKRRGITIQAQPVSFPINDIKVNLIDTPGHVDFIAEVERSMEVLDGAILVVSAKEGIQAHTYLLFNSLKKLNIPFIIFINKIDRIGTNTSTIIQEMKKSLTRNIIPIQEVYSEGSKKAFVSDLFYSNFSQYMEIVADHDENILDDYINNKEISIRRLKDSIISLSQRGVVNPIIFGSALSGTGIDELLQAIKQLLPLKKLKDSGQCSFRVFKIKRNSKDLKQFYIKVDSGIVRTRDSVKGKKINKIDLLSCGKEVTTTNLLSGDIGIIYGVDLEIGNSIGGNKLCGKISLGSPTLKVGIKTVKPEHKPLLIRGINRIAEADPFLEYELSQNSDEIYLNFFGEVQMEIVKDILLENHGVEVELLDPTVIYRETPNGSGSALIDMSDNDNPFHATVGLKIEAGEMGSGVNIKSDVRIGNVPISMWHGIHDGIHSALRQGLNGWVVTDIIITITKVEFNPISTPAEFRDMTPMVVLEALSKAGTKLLWPLLSFNLKVPEFYYGKAVSDLLKMKAVFNEPELSNETFTIEGSIPVATSRDYALELADYTSGKGIMVTSFYCYSQVNCQIKKERKKIYPDPLDKTLYIMSKRGRLNSK